MMTKPARLVVLKTGDPVPRVAETRGQFADLITSAVGDIWSGDWAAVDVRIEPPPDPDSGAAFIITGSSSSVTERAEWMLRAEEWIRTAHAKQTKIFGICFGHQLIAQALGGLVAKNPRGREIGKVTVEQIADDPIFEGLARTFDVHATHVDSVVTLPPGATLLAKTALEPNAAFSIGENIRTVQYHPEIDDEVMREYLKARWEIVKSEGLDIDAIYGGVGSVPHNAATLRNFIAQLVSARGGVRA
jgi:GMP synthase (glutamine-hydrolysing)